MGRKKRTDDRILGPTPHHGGYRITVIRGGETNYLRYETKEAALKKKGLLEQALKLEAEATVSEAITDYLEYLRTVKGRAQGTQDAARVKLREFFGEGDEPVRRLTPTYCQALYDALCESKLAVATQHVALTRARAFCGWLVRKGRLPANPCADIERVGQPEEGKRPLSFDESRRLLRECLIDPSPGSTAVLAYLLTGRRLAEIQERLVVDLDSDGAILHVKVKGGKWERSDIFEPLRSRLVALAKHKRLSDPLIGVSRRQLHRWCWRLCERAGVPLSSPHALRGTFSRLAQRQGVAAQAVADALSHTEAINRRHYGGAEAQAAAQQAIVIEVLQAGSAAPRPQGDA